MRKSGFFFILLGWQFLTNAEVIELEPLYIQNFQNLVEISSDRLKSLGFNSPEEALFYFSSLDLKRRGNFGIQQDISLRGSIFEDTEVKINNIRINDPQTGHFNLEIPLTLADIESIVLSKSEAEINFLVKRPESKGGLIRLSRGDYGLQNELFSFNFPLLKLKNRVSVERKKAKSSRQDRDFEIYNISFDSLYQKDNEEVEFLAGFTRRDFGADGFYAGPVYNQEEEHTTQNFLSLRTKFERENFNLHITPYFRRHTDKFILDRHNPSFYTNYHTSYLYGVLTRIESRPRGVYSEGEIVREKITSTNLGNHQRLRKSFSLGFKNLKAGIFFVDACLRENYYENWKYEDLSLKVALPLEAFLNVSFSYVKSFRPPSFTELFYSSPSNIGNRDLGLEKKDSFEWGINYRRRNYIIAVALFLREHKDTIDWVRDDFNSAWEAKNVGRLRTRGMDFNFHMDFNNLFLKNLTLGYTYLDLNRKNPYNFSKYVFNYLKHKLVADAQISFNRFSLSPLLRVEHPLGKRVRVVVNVKATCQLKDNLSLFIEGENIFNEEYEEIEGVKQSPRWYSLGLLYRF